MTNLHFVERKSCPTCGGLERAELYRCSFTASPIREFLATKYAQRGTVDFDLLEGAAYILQECGGCGLIYQEQIPDDHLMEIVYERWSLPERDLAHREKSVVRARGRYALEIMGILDFLRRDPKTLRFLDFGMGWGFWVQMAQALGVDAYGLELSVARTDYAERSGVKVIGPHEMHSMTFDFINTEQVFEHLTDPYGTAVELAGLLNEGGILKISVPNAFRVKRRLKAPDWTAPYGSRRSLRDVVPFQHINAFNQKALVTLGRRAGLEHVRIPGRLWYRYMPTWEGPKRVLKRTVGQHIRAMRNQGTVLWFRRAQGR